MLAKKNETIGKIICILSQAARDDVQRGADGLSAYEYFKKSVKNEVSEKYIAQKKLFRKKEPVPNKNNIPTDNDLIKFVEIVTYDADGNEKGMETLLEELCNEINKDDVVYIDTTGGPRTVLNLIQLLTKILKYKGIKNPCSFYSNIQGNNRFIQTTEETSLMLDIADSLNEFVNTGSSAQLRSLFDVSSPKAVRELLKSMNKFSESMQLCMIRNLDDNLKNLRKCIKDVRKIKSESISIVILKNLLPVIEEKFYNQDSIDYLKIIRWCLDNG
ncbi:MAG: TM1812 family CRISPR-associated protein, partial [Oscillospiraceae bacterium]|nr:TM1812 family CRISPR-associated protein [Oscillospiraceae bacterium]